MELDLSYRTVENHLAKAVQMLGAESRFAAARLLIASESAPEYKLPEYPESLVSMGQTAIIAAPDDGGGANAESDPAGGRKKEVWHDLLKNEAAADRRPFLIPVTDAEYRDLNRRQRLILIAMIGVLGLLAFAAVPVGFLALSRLL